MHKAPQFIPSKTLTLQPIINLKPIYFEIHLFYNNFSHALKLEKTARNCGRFDAWVMWPLKAETKTYKKRCNFI